MNFLKAYLPTTKYKLQSSNSFTLVELLVVIGILAVLTTAVVIILNPTDYLAQARDSRRLNDLSLLNNSLQNLEAIDSTLSFGTSLTVYISIPDDASSTCGTLGLPALPPTYTYNCVSTANLTNTDGTGWVPVNFSSQSIIQLSSLPIDPINTPTDGLYYTYTPGGSWEIDTILESNKYRLSGDKDRTSSDGGDNTSVYEIGTDLTTNPINDSGLVGYWKFDGGTSGSITNNQTTGFEDASGNNHTGTAKNTNGTGMSWITGKRGGAVDLDGTDDYVNWGNSFWPTSAFTLSFWFYADDWGSGYMSLFGGAFASTNANGGLGITRGQHTGYFSLEIRNSSGRNLFQANYMNAYAPSGQWNHLLWTWDGTTDANSSKSYINGVQRGANSSGTPTGTGISWSGVLVNLGTAYSPYYYFNGKMDDFRIYNRSFSLAEVKALYNATK
jgi:type II secretory pathway pseudopilin PulG